MPSLLCTDADLRQWRALHRMTQAQAARLFGVSQPSYGAWEAGKWPRDLTERMAEAEALRCAATGLAAKPFESEEQARKRLVKEIAQAEAKNAKRLAREARKRDKDLETFERDVRRIYVKEREQGLHDTRDWSAYLHWCLANAQERQARQPTEVRASAIRDFERLLQRETGQ
jgi:transcriptional regulator with XRE-family HTH domain